MCLSIFLFEFLSLSSQNVCRCTKMSNWSKNYFCGNPVTPNDFAEVYEEAEINSNTS